MYAETAGDAIKGPLKWIATEGKLDMDGLGWK